MPLTAPGANDEKYSPQHSVPARHNIGVLRGKIRRYTGDNTDSQTVTLAPPAQRIFEVRYFNTGAANYHDAWVALNHVSSLTGEAAGYTYTESTGVIAFGDGTDGYKPANGLIIEIEYEAKHVGESTTAPGYQRLQDGNGTTVLDVVASKKFNVYEGIPTAYSDGAIGPPVVKATLTDANSNYGDGWTVNEFANKVCVITEGPAKGARATIESNTATILTFTTNAPFGGTPPTTSSTYVIVDTLNAIPVLMQATINIDQATVDGFNVGEYRSTLPALTNTQNSQAQLTQYGATLVVPIPAHGTGAEALTYNADGTIATYARTINGKTFTVTYVYNADGTIASSSTAVS